MRWIREHKLISALLAILLALSIIFVVSLTGNGNDNVATDAVNKGTNTVSKGLSAVAGVIKKNVRGSFLTKSFKRKSKICRRKIRICAVSLQKRKLKESSLISWKNWQMF